MCPPGYHHNGFVCLGSLMTTYIHIYREREGRERYRYIDIDIAIM